jgi:hypothetical protein
MRRVIDQNEKFEIAKLVSARGEFIEYQVCDKSIPSGHKGFVVDRTRIAAKAREAAGIAHKGSGKETLPKTAYPEQQTGYKKPSPKGRR